MWSFEKVFRKSQKVYQSPNHDVRKALKRLRRKKDHGQVSSRHHVVRHRRAVLVSR